MQPKQMANGLICLMCVIALASGHGIEAYRFGARALLDFSVSTRLHVKFRISHSNIHPKFLDFLSLHTEAMCHDHILNCKPQKAWFVEVLLTQAIGSNAGTQVPKTPRYQVLAMQASGHAHFSVRLSRCRYWWRVSG